MMAKPRAAKGSFQDYAKLCKELTASDQPYVCLYGSSECLLELALETIRKKVASLSTAITTIEGAQLSEASFETIMGQPALFEGATMYVVRRAEQSKVLPKILKTLAPPKGVGHRLLLVWSGGEPSASVLKEMKRLGTLMVPCLDPWPNEIPQVLQTFASSLGIKLDPSAVQLLIEANGTDLIKHRHELNKISLLNPNHSGSLGRREIAPFLGLLRQDDAYQLDRLLTQRLWAHAHALTDALLARGEKALGLIAILSNHCRNVIRIQTALENGCSPANLSKEIRLPPFILKTYLPMAGRIDLPRYVQALKLCHDADLTLKSTSIAESILVAQIIEALSGPR